MKQTNASLRIAHRIVHWLAGSAMGLSLVAGAVQAQTLPASVNVAGNHAEVAIASPGLPGSPPLAEVLLDFQDASGLSTASLGISAQTVSSTDTALLARVPDVSRTKLQSALPLMVTIQPPTSGGLNFRGTGRIELHTHALTYTAGSRLRLFKAALGGEFYDITDEIASGSVRARGTYGGFSQFVILLDERTTSDAITAKIKRLRDRVDLLATSEQPAFDALLDNVESALAINDYAAALTAADAIRSRAEARAGSFIENEWRAARTHRNHAGELASGASTLRFSIVFLRDYGQ